MMSTDASHNVPDGYRPVDPWVISGSSDAAIAFMTEVFGASERPGSRVLNADGSVGHVEVELDGSVILMFDSQPGWPRLRRIFASTSTTLKPPSTVRWRPGRARSPP